MIPILVLLTFSIPIFGQEKLQKPEPKLEQILPVKPEKDSPWTTDPDSFREMEVLDLIDESNSQRRWKESQASFLAALKGFEDVSQSVAKQREDARKEVYKEDRYEWQKRAREEVREKDFARQIAEARNQAVQNLIKAMNTLDKIENPKVKENDPYIELKASIYREYIKHQDSIKNTLQVIDFLERYVALDDKFEREAEPHRLLALSYERLESGAQKVRKIQLSDEYKEQKKKHLVRFAELHYGINSREYNAILDRVARDY